MDLSERKKKILSAVIETNIKSSQTEAVSSKQLQEEYLPKVSSATIRNELNALEEMGYLTHLHTSSGRVPTKEGYEKYISELMQERKLTQKEKEIIKSNFSKRLVSLKDIIEKTAKTISSATNYTTIVYSSPENDAVIKDIKLYPVTSTTQLVVVVTNERVINELSSLGTNNEEDLIAASQILKDVFAGKPLSMIKDDHFRENIITSELQKYKLVFDRVIDIISSSDNNYLGDMSIVGKEKLIEYPEFDSVQKVKKAVSVLDDKELIIPLLKSGSDLELSINIGSNQNGLEDCSVVTVTCNVSGSKKITAGVIGPMRMDYQKAVSVLKEVADTLENSLEDKLE